MNETTELKPYSCPFCGGVNVVAEKAGAQIIVGCTDCAANMHGIGDLEELVAAWNRRADAWISVHDRLPRDGENVLAIDADGIPWLADYMHPNEYGGDLWHTLTDQHDEITHWQPLPPPPQSKIRGR